MELKTSFKSVDVVYKKVTDSPTGDLRFAFFQMAYVVSGSGVLMINGGKMPYRKGNLMVLNPDDRHNFEIKTETEFLLIRFYAAHLKEYKWQSVDHLECLLKSSSLLYGCILRNKVDFPLVETLTSSIIHGVKHGGIYNEDLLLYMVNALIVIAVRNIALLKPAGIGAKTDKRAMEIIDYIQDNILYPERIRAVVIAKRFGLSSTYLSAYFKEQCGETILHFISAYKIRLIEHRLQFSDQRINEIAHEFGFSDESHLNKFFKKHKDGVSLSAYRREAAV